MKIIMKKPTSVPKTPSATLPPREAADLRIDCSPSVSQPCTCVALMSVFSRTQATASPIRG